jgi:hypothetical protein
MSHVNNWLLVLSFLLGLVLTLAFMIRRVKREVPIYDSAKFTSKSAAKAKPESASATTEPKTEAFAAPTVDEPKTEVIRRSSGDEPKTEVISRSTVAGAAAAAGVVGGAALAGSGKDSGDAVVKDSDDASGGESKTEVISIPAAAAGAAGLAGAAALAGSGKGSDKDAGEVPYGAGSFRLVGGASVPSGWTIKGNEDSMLYHTTDSPSYKQTVAELWFRDEPAAQAAGFTHWKEGRAKTGGSGIAALADVPAGKFGAGSATPGAGGSGPQGWTIKGNEDSMLYHTTDSPSYKRTIAEVWFFDEDTAKNAGFRHWKEGRAKTGAANLVATEPEIPPGKFGLGSTAPGPGGSGPAGWTVKGNEDSMLYHSTESSAYDVTVAEVWFRDVPTAEAAGFNRWDSGKSQREKK